MENLLYYYNAIYNWMGYPIDKNIDKTHPRRPSVDELLKVKLKKTNFKRESVFFDPNEIHSVVLKNIDKLDIKESVYEASHPVLKELLKSTNRID